MAGIKSFLKAQLDSMDSPELHHQRQEMEKALKQASHSPLLSPHERHAAKHQLHELHRQEKQEKSLQVKVAKAVVRRLLK